MGHVKYSLNTKESLLYLRVPSTFDYKELNYRSIGGP